MKYTKIPKTNLEVSVLALGTWVFGGEMWAGSTETDCLEAVTRALDSGVNLIDTAPIYGNGRSEQIVGKAIKGKRHSVVLATKCGLIREGKKVQINLNPKSIRQEINESLRRLQVDYLDLYQCHWPDTTVAINETLAELNKIKEAGKIRYIGLSNYDLQQLKGAVAFGEIVTLQSHFSLLERSPGKEIVPFCQHKDIGVLAYGSMGGGVLTGKYPAPPKFDTADARNFFYKYYQADIFKKVQSLLAHLREVDYPLNQIAINWVRQQPGVTSVLVGCRNAQQASENFKAADWELSPAQVQKISSIKF